MQVHVGVGLLRPEWTSAIVGVGTFDGVHLGHVAVIQEAVRQAQELDAPSCVVTFDRHPAAILAPDRCPKAIAPLQANLRRFEELGVALAVVLPFDAALSRMSADHFLADILVGSVRATRVVVGHDFAMGNGREGTTDWLASRIPTTVVPPFDLDGVRVSSSRIRSAIESGDLPTVTRHLGRDFAIEGVVVGGQRLGRTLGYPTANLARSFDQVLPPDGVYAAVAQTIHGRFSAALSIGFRPAVGGKARTIEAYLLDYPGRPLYGTSVSLALVDRLRPEANFDSLEALKAQIAADVAQVRTILTARANH